MFSSPEKRLLWHPRRENRFVVGGSSQITLYEWRPEAPEIKHATSQHDLQLMKCFAWSPDPAFDDLIAVGLSTGKVDLMRLEAAKYAHDNVLSSGPCVSLPVRSSRSCNALAFCPVEPNYLAVGLDKVRGDSSLVIWDISSATPALAFRESAPSMEPTATKTDRAQPPIPRFDFGLKMDSRIIQQHAPAEIVSSLSFVDQSNCLLWAGISNRWLRLFDLRTATPSTTSVASKVQGIATDPFDTHRIGTFGDGVVSIWDSRRLPQPLMTFTERDCPTDGPKPQITFTTLEFSSVRRGVLATLETDATHVRFWNLQEAQADDPNTRERSRDSSRSARAGGGRLSWANPTHMLSWTGSGTSNVSSGDGRERIPSTATSNLTLSDTRKSMSPPAYDSNNQLNIYPRLLAKDFPSSLASFALVPKTREHPLTSNVMVVNKGGDLEVYAVHDTPNYACWSHQGDLTMPVGASYRVFPGFVSKERGPDPWDVPALPGVPYAASGGNVADQDNADKTPAESEQTMPIRGRSQSMVSPPTFGRGDEDGFPALNTAILDRVTTATSMPKSRSTTRSVVNGETTTRLSSNHRNASSSRTLSSLMMRDSLDQENNHTIHSPTPKEPEVFFSSSADKLASQSIRSSLRHGRYQQRTKNKRLSASQKMCQVIQNDISMTMRNRALKGYGLGNLAHNSVIANEDPVLSEVWLWINYSKHLLYTPKPRTHNFDFSGQGLLGIWEGPSTFSSRKQHDTVPSSPVTGLKSLLLEHASVELGQSPGVRSHQRQTSSRRQSPFVDHSTTGIQQDDFSLAISALSARHEENRNGDDAWKPGVPTAKLVQRRFGLQLCGWSLREEELNNAVRAWESENKHSQAACWLVFTEQYHRAVDLLMRSKDETHYLISGTLAALTPQASGGSGIKHNPDLRQHCERLIVRLQDPYLRAMLIHLTVNDWSEVLGEETIPLRERLAIALQFLDDKSLSSYLRRIANDSSHRGDISGLIVTGLTPTGFDILQSYVDITGDVQTVAVLSCFRTIFGFGANVGNKLNGKDDPVKVVIDRWVETYQDLLDGWKMFYHRCQFDIDRGKLLHDALQDGDIQSHAEWVPRQIMIRCNFCNKAIDVANSKSKGTNACPNCGRGLPRCSICLMTLTIAPDPIRDASLLYSHSKDTINDAIVFCQTCRHGGHASHIMKWFFDEAGDDGDGGRAHNICAVADCDCHCANEL